MNKNKHRIVFNKRSGQMMAVAETASAQSGGGDGESPVTSEEKRPIALVSIAQVAINSVALAVLLALGGTNVQAKDIVNLSLCIPPICYDTTTEFNLALQAKQQKAKGAQQIGDWATATDTKRSKKVRRYAPTFRTVAQANPKVSPKAPNDSVLLFRVG